MCSESCRRGTRFIQVEHLIICGVLVVGDWPDLSLFGVAGYLGINKLTWVGDCILLWLSLLYGGLGLLIAVNMAAGLALPMLPGVDFEFAE